MPCIGELETENARLQARLEYLQNENERCRIALTQVHNATTPLWGDLRELRGGYQTWEQYWQARETGGTNHAIT